MKKTQKTTLIFTLLTSVLSANSAYCAEIDRDLTARLIDRNELEQSVKEVKDYLYNPTVTERLQNWLGQESMYSYVDSCQRNLKPFFPAEKTIGPICYFLRKDNLLERKKYLPFVRHYLLERKAALLEILEDPRQNPSEENTGLNSEEMILAQQFLTHFKDIDAVVSKINTCFESNPQNGKEPRLLSFVYKSGAFDTEEEDQGTSISVLPFVNAAHCLTDTFRKDQVNTLQFKVNPYFNLDLTALFPSSLGHVISTSSWVPGNKVEYLKPNDTSEKLMKTLEVRNGKNGPMERLYPLSGAGSFSALLKRIEKNPLDVFTEKEGFYPSTKEHPVWNQTQGVFKDLLNGIDLAKETIFMDIFFLGGTMGASLAKHLVENLETKKGSLKAFIIRDNYNHYGHEAEMRPVFNYLLAYSYLHPDRLVITGAYIKEHHSGLPKFVEGMVSDVFLVESGIQKHLVLYGRAISDHSKTIVIDVKTENPTAFVGSKNLTDASGAICYDEIVKVSGPVAAVVQDEYYDDMAVGLKKEMSDPSSYADLIRQLKGDGYPSFATYLAKNGWAKDPQALSKSIDENAKNILKPFDLLERDANGKATRDRSAPLSVLNVGNTVVRTGMNNWDSTRMSAVDEVIQMILSAKKTIYINDQFLFDRRVVLALFKAKEDHPGLEIQAILHKFPPNYIYLKELHDHGIAIKWKNILEGGKGVDQEFHGKTISADGMSVIVGSANKDQSTMYGSFREEQLEVYDSVTAQAHDQMFKTRWNDLSETSTEFVDFDPKDFPQNIKGFDGKPLAPAVMFEILQNVISILFDARRI